MASQRIHHSVKFKSGIRPMDVDDNIYIECQLLSRSFVKNNELRYSDMDWQSTPGGDSIASNKY